MNRCRNCLTVLLVGIVFGSVPAHAFEEKPAVGEQLETEKTSDGASTAPPAAPAKGGMNETRRWGLGSRLGGIGYGFSGLATTRNFMGTSLLAFHVPTFEFVGFRRNGGSIQLSIPIVETIVVAAQRRQFYFGVDMFSNSYPVRGERVSMIAGPGVGLHMTVSPNFAMPMLRIHGGIGAEITFLKRRLGLTIIGIPFLQVSPAFAAGHFQFVDTTLGLAVSVGIIGYKHR